MGVITGRIVGASGPTALPVPAVGQVVASAVALRALAGSVSLPAVTMLQYAAAVPNEGGGTFVWDAAARTDDGVSRFNAGGLASSGAGWQRVEGGAVRLSWAGAVGDGTTDDTAAVQRAIAAAVASGGVVSAEPGRRYRLTATITISSAVTIMGDSAAPAGGVQGYANPFPTFLHDFDGDCFVFDGAVGGAYASGGGLENLRIVQVFGTAGTAYGSAVKVAGIDGSHRPAWCKFRALIIEETGAGVWTWALEFDGATAALSDMYCSEISSHTDNTAAQSAGAIRINGAQVTMYNCLHYLGERGVVMGDTDECGSCQFSNVSVSGASTFDNAHDITIIGGIWGDLDFTANVTGNNTIIPGRLSGAITNAADNQVGVLYFDPTLEFQAQDYGAFRTNRYFAVPNNRWFLGERITAGTAYPLLGLDGEDACRVLPFGEVPIVLGPITSTTAGQPAGTVLIGKSKSLRGENNATNGFYPLIAPNASDQVEIGDATHPVPYHTGLAWVGCSGSLAPGSHSFDADQWHIQYRRLQLTGAQRLTLAGTARYILTDL